MEDARDAVSVERAMAGAVPLSGLPLDPRRHIAAPLLKRAEALIDADYYGPKAYVLNPDDSTVTPVRVATNTAGNPIQVGPFPVAIAITPDGRTAYVVNQLSGTVTPIRTATNTTSAPISLGRYPRYGANPVAIAITPDGRTAYVVNYYGGTVTPIATATERPGTPIRVGKFPLAIAITPDGRTAYLVNSGSGTVTPIRISADTAGKPIKVGYFRWPSRSRASPRLAQRVAARHRPHRRSDSHGPHLACSS